MTRLIKSLFQAAFLAVVIVWSIWALVPNAQSLEFFKPSEFADREPPHESKMDQAFLLKLNELRRLCGFPLYINSGYRSPKHSIEIVKEKPGTHSKGIAVDIKILNSNQMRTILKYAMQLGFTGIGIYSSHIHLDTRNTQQVTWVGVSYNVQLARDTPRR